VNLTLARIALCCTYAAALLILLGIVLFLIAHGDAPYGDHIFRGEPASLRSPSAIFQNALEPGASGQRRSLTQLGVLLLLLNPFLRVAFAGASFAAAKNRLYTAVSAAVFLLLLLSFLL
jgi:uncharacterized membrane protein